MKAVSVYQKKYHIESNDVDFRKKLKLSSLFGYFQEIACLHADNLGVGVYSIENSIFSGSICRYYGLALNEYQSLEMGKFSKKKVRLKNENTELNLGIDVERIYFDNGILRNDTPDNGGGPGGYQHSRGR